MAKTKNTLTYDDSSIKVQKYPENVRTNPTVYISSLGIEGNNHLLREIIDNSVDEYLNGFGNTIKISISNKTGTFKVSDSGRGIPPHSIEKAFTTLHASGKFDKNSYSTSGGQHGLGATCVNALSSRFEVITAKEGFIYKQKFEKGLPVSKLSKGKETDKTGTTIIFSPDSEIMETDKIDLSVLKEECEMKSFINKGLKIIIENLDTKKSVEYYHENGITEYISLNAKKRLSDIITCSSVIPVEKNGSSFNIDVDFSFVYNNTTEPINIRSFCNSIYTSDGGTHETGFKIGLTGLIKKYIADNNILTKKDANLDINGDAIQEGVVAIISIKHPHPMYDQQSKKKLNSTDVQGAVLKVINTEFSKWIESHPKEMKTITTKVIESARANSAAKRAKEYANKKSESGITAISDLSKLSNCISKNPEECELFICEGNSAGSTCKNGRDKRTQAIYALRGKILNTINIDRSKIFENKELSDLIYILTGKKTAIGKDFQIDDLKYHKVVALTDADYDGLHIASLLLGFIYKYARSIIENGYMYVAMPPLYSIIEKGKKRYFLNQEEYDEYIEDKIYENFEFTEGKIKYNKNQVKKFLKQQAFYKKKLKEIALSSNTNIYLIDTVVRYLNDHPSADNKTLFKFIKSLGDFESIKNNDGDIELNGLYEDEFVNIVVKTLIKSVKSAKNILDKLEISNEILVNGEKFNLHIYDSIYEKVTPKSRSRFKGLGEMDADQLWETTLDPSVRNIMQVVLSDEEKTDEVMDTLLNSNSKFADKRKVFLLKNQEKIKELEIEF